MRCVSSEVHSVLLSILQGNIVPKKERTPPVLAAYRIKRRRVASCATVTNPLSGKKEERVIIESKILLMTHEVGPCITMYFAKYKGVGARKLYSIISRSFCGISERDIQTFLNKEQISQKLHPSFMNKKPLNPVESRNVMDRVQMDIVDMQNQQVEKEGKCFKYVLVVMDICSRFVFLRPLETKSSAEVVTHVIGLISDIGPPKVVQTDQGTEFKGVVQMLMKKFKIRIIHSRPYHPQSQGKVRINLFAIEFKP